ncbi:MAG: DUF4337 domain-containing protein [Candidatus Tectomicrobia bacterium]|nr:DUF4337 domain-containing protein [Candidatus Tectomicrobia bacterium]
MPMDASEVSETISNPEGGGDERFRKAVAIYVGLLAMLLAITSLGGENASKEMMSSNISASNLWAFYQAKNIRQTSFRLAADELEALLASRPDLAPGDRQSIEKRIEGYKQTAARYESEPSTGEGKKELTVKAREQERRRDRAERQDFNFDISIGLFQIAIVLASVSILAASRLLFYVSGALALAACALSLNGFFLLVPLG